MGHLLAGIGSNDDVNGKLTPLTVYQSYIHVCRVRMYIATAERNRSAPVLLLLWMVVQWKIDESHMIVRITAETPVSLHRHIVRSAVLGGQVACLIGKSLLSAKCV